MKASENKRHQRLRRQINEAFTGPDGKYSLSKTMAVFAQIGVLYHTMGFFDRLIDKPETMLILLTFLIAPDVIKKALSMKLGGVPSKG